MDDGTFLTDNGSEIMKKIKVKPAPARRARPTKATTIRSSSCDIEPENIRADKNDDDSRSSSEDKTEFPIDDPNQSNEPKIKSFVAPAAVNMPKRTVLIGLGGFNSKSRNRIKVVENAEMIAMMSGSLGQDQDNKTKISRKKKTTIEDLIPTNMQDAFFGSNVLAKCREANFDLDEELDDTNSLCKMKFKKDSNHQISLDENMLNSAQQNKKGHLELGIEDLLDGDIVSYLFSENRSLIDYPEQDYSSRNRNSDEKIFDEKLYEDLFQQMVSEPNQNSNNKETIAGSQQQGIFYFFYFVLICCF